MNFDTFADKTVEKCKNTFLKQQVISKLQKLLHFSRAWAQVNSELIACKKSEKQELSDFIYLSLYVKNLLSVQQIWKYNSQYKDEKCG